MELEDILFPPLPCLFRVQMNSDVTSRFKEVTQDFKVKLPVIVELGNPAMQPRHWQKLFKVRTTRRRPFSKLAKHVRYYEAWGR